MGVPSEIQPDTLLGGKFRLIQRIGRGGMGDVWVARNEATQAEVAIKLNISRMLAHYHVRSLVDEKRIRVEHTNGRVSMYTDANGGFYKPG